MTLRTGCIALLAMLVIPILPREASAQSQGPIRIIFDLHCDPMPMGIPYAQQVSVYQTRVDNIAWVLDQTEPLGVQISYLSGGQFMEHVVQEGAAGSGAQVLQRIYAAGGQIGSHSHNEYQISSFDWGNFPGGASLADSQTSWQDNIDWVNQAILTALGSPPPEPLSEINGVKGAHLPSNEPDFHDLMALFQLHVREGGPEEDYYGWFKHHIWNPFRPSEDNYMAEDLQAGFVVPTQGSVIGLAQIHHGIFQDMTAEAMKRQFLQLYVNWRYRDRFGLPEKVWSWGWGSHATDFDPGDPSRTALVDVLQWLQTHFVGRVEASGSQVMQWDTQRNIADVYEAWEAAHPGVSSFSFDALAVDWNSYPYLRAVAEEMADFLWVADLNLGAGMEAFELEKGPLSAVLVWSESGSTTLDLSSYVGPRARVVNLETGVLEGLQPTAVSVGAAPLFVTSESFPLSVQGTPTLGATLRFELQGPPQVPAALYLSFAPANVAVPHFGNLQLDTGASLQQIAAGMTSAGGRFAVDLTVPNNANWLGQTGWVQGTLTVFDGASTKLSDNALMLTVQ